MNQPEIYERLQAIFRDLFDERDLVLTADTTARDVERWDSLSHVAMMVRVEEAFGIRFSTREVTGLANVGALAQVIGRKAA